MLKQFIFKKRYKNKCIFEKGVLIDSRSRFEGGNRLTNNVVFLNSSLGFGSYVGERSRIQNTVVGRYTCIAPEVVTVLGNHPIAEFASVHPAFYSIREQAGFSFVTKDKYQDFKYCDNNAKTSIVIGNDVWVGYGVKIMEGVNIGDGVVIAAGAVVTKDIPPYSIVGGVPAKLIKYRFNTIEIEKLLDIQWWNRDISWIKEKAEYFENIHSFINTVD